MQVQVQVQVQKGEAQGRGRRVFSSLASLRGKGSLHPALHRGTSPPQHPRDHLVKYCALSTGLGPVIPRTLPLP